MNCPYCGHEAEKQAVCPYCKAAIPKPVQKTEKHKQEEK